MLHAPFKQKNIKWKEEHAQTKQQVAADYKSSHEKHSLSKHKRPTSARQQTYQEIGTKISCSIINISSYGLLCVYIYIKNYIHHSSKQSLVQNCTYDQWFNFPMPFY